MWVKICANTNLDDALLAVELGADALGFVFTESKRQVTPGQARAITDHLPQAVERVGVFTGQDLDTIVASVRDAGLTAVQMHGGLNLEAASSLRERLGANISLIHVLHWTLAEDDASRDELRDQLRTVASSGLDERILLDTKIGQTSGGLGVAFNWAQAGEVLADFPSLQIIAAGGLRPENVSDAIAALLPFGVDVVTGVEFTPGRKDPRKLRAFIENARRA